MMAVVLKEAPVHPSVLAYTRAQSSCECKRQRCAVVHVQAKKEHRFTLPLTRVIVSSNAEQYRVVEITGAPNGAYIRERVYSKLCIPDERHPQYSVYQSQIGAFALSRALSDGALFELCRRYGDPAGSLVLFVSTAPDRPPTTRYDAEQSYFSSYVPFPRY